MGDLFVKREGYPSFIRNRSGSPWEPFKAEAREAREGQEGFLGGDGPSKGAEGLLFFKGFYLEFLGS